MHKALGIISILIAVISLVSNFKNLNTPSSNENLLAETMKPQSKYWLLSNYADSILRYKSIAKYSDNPLSWNAVVLRLEADSLYATGTLSSATRKLPPRNIVGMITSLNEYGEFTFSYNPVSKHIIAVSSPKSSTGIIVNNYRPISESEYFALFRAGEVHPLQEGMRQAFIAEMFAGDYRSIERKPKDMTITATGEIKGFQKFKKYELQDYFGTSHPFNGLDAIWLENNSGTGNYYHWAFAGDTLTLTEMRSEEETYLPTSRSWKFLKATYNQ